MKKLFNNQTTLFSILIASFVLFFSCSNAELVSPTEPNLIDTGFGYETNMDEEFLQALQELEQNGRGNFGHPDFANEGEMYYMSTLGSCLKIPMYQAVELVKKYKWIDVNGSGTCLKAAQESTFKKVNLLGVNMVLVYIAQGLDYWNAEDTNFKSNFETLVNAVTADKTRIYTISHSWSGHIVMDKLRNNPYVTHFTINPAHGNLKEGEKIADYVNDLANTISPTYILAGKDDPVSRLGGGTAWKEWWGIAGYNSVYKSDLNNDNVFICTIEKSSHSMDDMIAHGAFDIIKQKIK